MSNNKQYNQTHYLHAIIDQNQQLRHRINKLSQIQQYTQALLIKCETSQIQKQQILGEYDYLNKTNQRLKIEIENNYKNHKQEIRMVLLQHDEIMKKMQQELKIIKVQYEKQITQNDQLKIIKNQLTDNLSQLKQRNKIKQTSLNKQITQLKEMIVENQQEYQILSKQYQLEKSQNLKQKQSLIKQIYNLKAVVLREQKRYIDQLEITNSKLKKQNQGLKLYNQEISKNSVIRERQLNQQIRIIKSENQFKEGLFKKQINALQSNLQIKIQEYETSRNNENFLIDENIKLKRDCEQSCINSERLCFMLEQSDKQNTSLREKIKQIQSYLSSQIQNYKQEYYNQRDHNNELTKILSDKQYLLNQKLKEIKDLLNIIDEIENENKIKIKQNSLLKEEIEKMELELQMTGRNLEERSFEIRALQEKFRILKNNCEDLQNANNLFKKQFLQFQTENHNLRRQLLNPRRMSHQVQDRVQELTIFYQKQRDRQFQQHQLQKQKLRETYQFQIRQQQMRFLRKIQFFQQQVSRLK